MQRSRAFCVRAVFEGVLRLVSQDAARPDCLQVGQPPAATDLLHCAACSVDAACWLCTLHPALHDKHQGLGGPTWSACQCLLHFESCFLADVHFIRVELRSNVLIRLVSMFVSQRNASDSVGAIACNHKVSVTAAALVLNSLQLC